MSDLSNQAGLGLRIPHLDQVLAQGPSVAWFEVHICNFLTAPLNKALLAKIAQDYPLSFHGVSLNLGGTDPLNIEYLNLLKQSIDTFQPKLISEHACFTGHQGESFHDLLPVPYTESSLKHFANRVDAVQSILGRQILIENVSRYLNYEQSTMSEAEFLAQLCKQTGCKLILDINNIYVNQTNHQQDSGQSLAHFLQTLAFETIGEIHLAGHAERDGQLIDTHGTDVCEAVWSLFKGFLTHCAALGKPCPPCLIERDNNLPKFDELQEECIQAQLLIDKQLGQPKRLEEAV